MKSVKNGNSKNIGSAARDVRGMTYPPTSSNLRGFEVQIYICYTRHYLLRGGPIALALQDVQFDDLTTTNNTLFPLSILSLATLFFGTQHKNTSITTHGFHLHGLALQSLNKALSSPQCQFRDDVLLSVIALVLQEAFIPTGSKYFLKHTSGLEKLLELRGPSMLSTPESYLMFKSVRKIIILASMRRREPSILAREEWKSIPWDDESEEGKAEKYLFDVLAEYTVLVSALDRLLHDRSPENLESIKQRSDLGGRGQELLAQLYSWKADWDNHTPHLENATSSSLTPSTATTLMLYNTTEIYILQILASLYPPPSPPLPSLPPFQSPHLPPNFQNPTNYKTLQQKAALQIKNLIPYHQAHKSQLDPGSLTIGHLAVRTAFLTLGGRGMGGLGVGLDAGWGGGTLEGEGEGGGKVEVEVFARGLWGD